MSNGSVHKPIQAQFRAARVVCLHATIAAALPVPSPAFKQHSALLITLPVSSLSATAPVGTLFAAKEGYFSKSSAQVATSVTQTVLQKSCGLKPKNLEDQKSETCSVRFQAGELAIIRTKAQLAGVSTNTYIRAASLGSDYKQPINPELQKTLQAGVKELTAQGNNLNQIAKQLNGGTVTPDQAMSMLDAIRVPLVRALLAVRNALVQGEPQP